MTARVIYQPCSDDVARKNLQTTILNPVLLSDIADLLSLELQASSAGSIRMASFYLGSCFTPNQKYLARRAARRHGDLQHQDGRHGQRLFYPPYAQPRLGLKALGVGG